MSVLARPQWCVRSPPRLPHNLQVELSPLSACSAGSPGDLGEEEGAYGGSLIMVQQMVEHTEQAAEAEDEERLCSVVLDPLPSSLLQSLSAQGHVRMLRPPAAATWPTHEVPPETAFLPAEHGHRKKSRKARRESYDADGRRKKRKRSTSSSSGCEPDTPRVNPIFVWVTQSESTITQVMCEDYDKRNRIRLTKTPNGWRAIPRTVLQPTIQSEPCSEPEPQNEDTLDLSAAGRHRAREEEQVETCKQEHVAQLDHVLPQEIGKESDIEDDNMDAEVEDRVNNIISSLEESDLATNDVTEVTLENLASEEVEESMQVEDQLVDDDTKLMEDDVCSTTEDNLVEDDVPSNEIEEEHVECNELEDHPDNSIFDNIDIEDQIECISNSDCNDDEIDDHLDETQDIEAFNLDVHEHDNTSDVDNNEDDDNNICELDNNQIDDDIDNESNLEINEDETEVQNLTTVNNSEDADDVTSKDNVIAEDFSSPDSNKPEGQEEAKVVKKVDKNDFEDATTINTSTFTVKCKLALDEVKDEKKVLPPRAHASSSPVKQENIVREPATDLSCKRRRRLSGILPCRNVLRLPPLSARAYTSPIPCPASDRRSPSPAHRQNTCILPAITPECGTKTPRPAHQHFKPSTNLLEGLLSQQPLALDTTAKRPASSQESPSKRRKSEDVTLRSLLKPVKETGPPSRLLELLTTANAPQRKPSPVMVVPTPAVVVPPTPPSVPTSPAPLDALAQLRLVLQEVPVPDPLFVPRSRLAALLASPATEIPRLVCSPPPATPDTLAVSLSRLHALLKRPDSELLAWAARDWAKPPTLPPVITKPPSVPKPPPTKKSHSNKELHSSLPWWVPNKTVPPPPSPEILAAIHAMYGPTLLQPHYFAPHYPEMALWQAAHKSQPQPTLTSRPPHEHQRAHQPALTSPKPKPVLTSPQPKQQQAAAKPRIACKSLLDLLAKKPEESPALNLVRAPVTTKPERRVHQPDHRDSTCPRLWHPLFGSQKCDTWNWRPVSVRGE